jgi:hypothetical protein
VKRPAFQFYPADWRKDPALSSCSLAARGLWIELLCVAHESDDYGHLTVNGNAMTDVQIARSVGEAVGVVKRLLTELEHAGVFSRDVNGAIFSRRMERDERIRSTRAECGKMGGNPVLLNQNLNRRLNQNLNRRLNQPLNRKDKQASKLAPTPSVSASSSASELQNRDSEFIPRSVASGTPELSTGPNVALEKTSRSTAKVNGVGQRWDDPSYVAASAQTLGIQHRQGESQGAFRDRVFAAAQAQRRGATA